MRCPTLSELPPPPSGKTGWPWTQASPQPPDQMPDGAEWPKISIVTPNYNYGRFIEETIRSVLLQGYPNLEYIVIDGGSMDDSVEIIKKYQSYLTYWESKPDRGQTHAINKGLERATGEIFNWINSDDILMPGALLAIAQGIQGYDAFAGVGNNFDEEGNQIKVFQQNLTSEGLLIRFNTNNKPSRKDTVYHQPAFWFKTQLLKNIGNLNENLQLQFDIDQVVKYLYHYPEVNYSNQVLVNFRCHQEQKTASSNIKQEGQYIVQSLLDEPEYQNLHKPAKLWLERLLWYENLAKIHQQPKTSRIIKVLKALILSCKNPQAYWTRYTFGSIRQLLIRSCVKS